jgi:hypothetical protein
MNRAAADPPNGRDGAQTGSGCDQTYNYGKEGGHGDGGLEMMVRGITINSLVYPFAPSFIIDLSLSWRCIGPGTVFGGSPEQIRKDGDLRLYV